MTPNLTTTKLDKHGHPYRLIDVNGVLYSFYAHITKQTIYRKYGIVFVGFPFSVEVKDGSDKQVMEGYTDNKVFLDNFREMMAETGEDVDDDGY